MRRRQRPPDRPEPVRSRISEAHRRFVQALVYIHFGSLVACAAAGLQAHGDSPAGAGGDMASMRGSETPETALHDFVDVVDDGDEENTVVRAPLVYVNRATLVSWMGGSRERQRAGDADSGKSAAPDMSYRWRDEDSPEEICRIQSSDRVARLNSTYLFPEQHPISIWEIFSGGSSIREHRLRLREGVQGYDCVNGSQYECLHCFSRVRAAIRRLTAAYSVFNATLHRFDCMPAVDTASATRPFSPNGSCEHCKTWYGRWLLVHVLEVWEQRPCINWCYYAQLACPHLATSKVVDYAGHPSFQCRDLHIPIGDSDVYSCNCVHPCDVRGAVNLKSGSGFGSTTGNDFFAARHHCATRRKHCANTAHDRSRQGSSSTSRRTGDATQTTHVVATALPLALLISMHVLW